MREYTERERERIASRIAEKIAQLAGVLEGILDEAARKGGDTRDLEHIELQINGIHPPLGYYLHGVILEMELVPSNVDPVHGEFAALIEEERYGALARRVDTLLAEDPSHELALAIREVFDEELEEPHFALPEGVRRPTLLEGYSSLCALLETPWGRTLAQLERYIPPVEQDLREIADAILEAFDTSPLEDIYYLDDYLIERLRGALAFGIFDEGVLPRLRAVFEDGEELLEDLWEDTLTVLCRHLGLENHEALPSWVRDAVRPAREAFDTVRDHYRGALDDVELAEAIDPELSTPGNWLLR